MEPPTTARIAKRVPERLANHVKLARLGVDARGLDDRSPQRRVKQHRLGWHHCCYCDSSRMPWTCREAQHHVMFVSTNTNAATLDGLQTYLVGAGLAAHCAPTVDDSLDALRAHTSAAHRRRGSTLVHAERRGRSAALDGARAQPWMRSVHPSGRPSSCR
jgi:hypothetical protein